MKSDEAAEKIVAIKWEHQKANSPTDETFYGIVTFLDTFEMARFKISKGDYQHDNCAPCESRMKALRGEIAKRLREVYGE